MTNAMRNAVLGVTTLLIAALLVAGGFLGRMLLEPGAQAPTTTAAGSAAVASNVLDTRLLAEVAAILESDFVDASRAIPEVLSEGALNGLLGALNDPHTVYIDPETYALSRDDFEGTFQGIGATVSRQGNYVVIVRPIPNTPADRAGLRAGDIILAVDGEDAENWSVEQAVLRIRGQRGTTVELTVRHTDGVEETLVIERDDIPVESVIAVPPGGVLRDEDGEPVEDVAYIYIRQFSRTTPAEIEPLIRQAVADGKRGIILDVRSNPGGLLNETIVVTDMFLDGGAIFSQVNRAGQVQTASATPGLLTDLPIVVVQDEFSASGAELFAAAIQENGRGYVVGTRSFGKGTVNHSVPLSNGGAAYVSIARWLTPNGTQIEGNGVIPDVAIALTLEDIEAGRDVALARAVAVLRSGIESVPSEPATPLDTSSGTTSSGTTAPTPAP